MLESTPDPSPIRSVMMSASRDRLGVAAAGLVLVLGACAEDTEVDPPPGQDLGGEQAALEEEEQAATPGAVPVEVVNFGYDPQQLTVAPRTTVTWTNQDPSPHTVTAGEPGDAEGDVDEALDPDGGSASVTFDEEGTFVYHCSLHPNMTGEIVVEQAPA
jgi:plastocyanin